MSCRTSGDKLNRGITDFGAEAYALQEKRDTVAAAYRAAITQLTDVIKQAASMLSLLDSEALQDT